MAHTCTRAQDGVVTDRRQLRVAAHLHRSAQRGPVLTQRECAPLGSCLVGGGERTHSLRTQAHTAIITLISGGLGKLEEGGGADGDSNRKGSLVLRPEAAWAGLGSAHGDRALGRSHRALRRTENVNSPLRAALA